MQSSYLFLDDDDQVISLCSQIPESEPEAVSARLLRAYARRRKNELQEGMKELREAFEPVREKRPQDEFLSLIIDALDFAVEWGLPQDAEEITDYLISYIRGHDLIKANSFCNAISNLSVTVNTHAWPRKLFRRLAEAVKESGWLAEEEYQGMLDSMFSCTESYDALEDSQTNKAVLELFRSFHEEMEISEFLPEVLWCGIKAWEKDPESIEYLKVHYPYYTDEVLDQVTALLNDKEKIVEQAEKDLLASENFQSKQEVMRHLKSCLEAADEPFNDFRFDMDDYSLEFAEEDRIGVENLLSLYFLHEYEKAASLSKMLQNESGSDPEGLLRYIEAMSLMLSGKGKQGGKISEQLRQEFPESRLSLIANAEALRASRNYRKADKMYGKIEASFQDHIHFAEGYADVLRKLGKTDVIRTVIQKMLDDTNFWDERKHNNAVEEAFYYAGHVMRIDNDILSDETEFLEEDVQLLKTLLLRKRPYNYAEYEFSRWITNLCSTVCEHKDYLDTFLDLIRFMEENRTFSDQNLIIESGYAAAESAYALEEEDLGLIVPLELVYLLKDRANGDSIPESRYYEACWYAAEAMRDRPDTVSALEKKYPHFMKDQVSFLKEVSGDPDRIQKKAEQYLSQVMMVSPSVIGGILRKSFQETCEAEMKRRQKHQYS